jgi:hypothetical protein
MQSVNDIRELIGSEIEMLQNGKRTPATFNAIRGGLSLVLSSVKLELEYAKALNKNPDMSFFEINLDSQPKKQEEARP